MRKPARAASDAVRTIGRYAVVRHVAHGGSCDVLEAIDPDLGRRVAIKVLREGAIDRLRVEATAAGRLHHPNIVAIHEVGPDYIVMDYIEGRTLAVAAPALARGERLKIVETIARAVEHAHSKGVIHRDLKPGNVLIERDGRVVLTDFGLAKLSDGEDLTVTGSVMGTPQYMAPEQVQARGFGPSVDVWALGVLLYEAVSGRLPFQGGTALEIYDAIIRREPPQLRGALGAVAARALEKDPRRRYASAGELADDLARHLRGEGVKASMLWPRVRRIVPRAAVLTIALGAAGVLYAQHRAQVIAARAENAPMEAAKMEKYRAIERAATAALTRSPRALDTLIQRSEARQRLGDLERDHGRNPLPNYAAALEDADAAIALDPPSRKGALQRAQVLTQRAVYKLRYGLDPLPDCDAAEAELTRVLGEGELRPRRGWLNYYRGSWLDRTEGNGRPLLLLAEADLTPAADAGALMRRGRVRGQLGKYDEADRDFAMALDLDPKNGWAWARRGEARLRAGDLVMAEHYLDRALEIDHQRADMFESRGDIRFARANFSGARADYREAIARNPSYAPLLAERMRQTEPTPSN